jgi:hypothetical protein
VFKSGKEKEDIQQAITELFEAQVVFANSSKEHLF